MFLIVRHVNLGSAHILLRGKILCRLCSNKPYCKDIFIQIKDSHLRSRCFTKMNCFKQHELCLYVSTWVLLQHWQGQGKQGAQSCKPSTAEKAQPCGLLNFYFLSLIRNLCDPVRSKRLPATSGPTKEERPAVRSMRPRGLVRLVLEAMVTERTTITLEM